MAKHSVTVIITILILATKQKYNHYRSINTYCVGMLHNTKKQNVLKQHLMTFIVIFGSLSNETAHQIENKHIIFMRAGLMTL